MTAFIVTGNPGNCVKQCGKAQDDSRVSPVIGSADTPYAPGFAGAFSERRDKPCHGGQSCRGDAEHGRSRWDALGCDVPGGGERMAASPAGSAAGAGIGTPSALRDSGLMAGIPSG